MKVICINDAGRPNEIPTSKWLKKDQEYTVIKFIKCSSQGGAIAFVLEEIDLSGCEPYKGFNSNRFAISMSNGGKLTKETRPIEEEVLA